MSGLRHGILSTGVGYIIVYSNGDGQEVFRFEVEDIEHTSWGLMATFVVRSRISGVRTLAGQFVTMDRFNMLQGKARMDFAATVARLIRAPHNGAAIDWNLTVDEVVHDVIEQAKKPLDVLDLSKVQPSGPDQFLIPQVIARGKTTLLYAAGGTGKSILAAGMAAAIQTGCSFLDWQVEQANALYLDWETDPGDLSDRVHRVSKGMGLSSAAPVNYINLTQPFRHHQSQLAQVIKERNIGFVILDSVAMASSGGGSNVTDGAVEFFRGLRSFDVAVLAIDHISSDDVKRGKPTSKAMGSVAKGNTARSTFELRETTEEGGPHRVSLRHSKANNTRKFAEVSIVMEWTDDAVRFKRDGYIIPDEPLDIRIMDLLGSGPASASKMAELLGEGEFDIRRYVAELRKDGLVTMDMNTGIYRIAEKGTDAPATLGMEEKE